MKTTTSPPETQLNAPLRVLTVQERWDCHSCGICCKAHTVFLDADDQARLDSQEWHKHPEFAGKVITRRVGLLGREQVLAQKPDGSCVFLTDEGLCSIHKEFGEPAKPWACRMFPFQVLPTAKGNLLTMRRNCPSAAADKGRPLREHLDYARSLAGKAIPDGKQIFPPRITAASARDWSDAQRVLDSLQKLMLEPLPLVRKLIHGVLVCNALEQCRPASLTGPGLKEMLGVFEADAKKQAGQRFADRQPPSAAGAMLFRQSAGEYMRLHPNMGDSPGWKERFRLFRAALQIARGKGELPKIHPDLPAAKFSDLERPLGNLSEEVLKPLHAYFEAMAASTQYCGAGRSGWSIVDGFHALALAYPIALWALRWLCVGREPTVADTIDVICIVDRSHYYPLLNGYRHRKRLQTLNHLGDLTRSLVWYAR